MIFLFTLIASKNNNIFDRTYLIGIILNLFFLHGLNNKIVYGGWFVGTIIFPWFLNCFAINSIYIYIIFLPLCFAFFYFAGICLLKFSQMLRSIFRGVL